MKLGKMYFWIYCTLFYFINYIIFQCAWWRGGKGMAPNEHALMDTKISHLSLDKIL